MLPERCSCSFLTPWQVALWPGEVAPKCHPSHHFSFGHIVWSLRLLSCPLRVAPHCRYSKDQEMASHLSRAWSPGWALQEAAAELPRDGSQLLESTVSAQPSPQRHYILPFFPS